MAKKSDYDPVKELYSALEAEDITLDFALVLFGTWRELVRILRHGLSDGFLEVYETYGAARRYIDGWEVEELVKKADKADPAAKRKDKVFIAVTNKGREGKK